MIIKHTDRYSSKPKNYSRKMFICTCQCPIITIQPSSHKDKVLDRVMVKYEIEFNKDRNYNINSVVNYKPSRYNYTNHQYWGKFKQVIEIPALFYKLEDEDYIVKTATFERDGVRVPFICEIEILNIEKYEIVKNKQERKKKLNKIINL
jgi:hypothetical protein